MKERPILFSSSMVRAILDGRKTQTRRVMRIQPGDDLDNIDEVTVRDMRTGRDFTSPYGIEGDRLWCKETFSTDALTVYPCPPVWYRADCGMFDDPADGEHSRSCDALQTGRLIADCYACAMNGRRFRWKPSIFMPRKLSRITLEITEVRVQRLQEISEDDARAEGCSGTDPEPAAEGGTIYAWRGRSSAPCPRAHFLHLWDSINGKRCPWSSNCWVWAITFRRVQP